MFFIRNVFLDTVQLSVLKLPLFFSWLKYEIYWVRAFDMKPWGYAFDRKPQKFI